MSTEGRARARALGPGPGPEPRPAPQPSVDMNWPWSDLLTDVVLTSVGGLGLKGRGEGVVWMGEPLWASDSVKRHETNHCNQGRGAARDKWLLQEKVHFLEKVLPQAAKLPGTSGFFKKNPIFENKFCPRQQGCLGHVVSSRKSPFSAKSSAPGSEAARDKWLLQKS